MIRICTRVGTISKTARLFIVETLFNPNALLSISICCVYNCMLLNSWCIASTMSTIHHQDIHTCCFPPPARFPPIFGWSPDGKDSEREKPEKDFLYLCALLMWCECDGMSVTDLFSLPCHLSLVWSGCRQGGGQLLLPLALSPCDISNLP